MGLAKRLWARGYRDPLVGSWVGQSATAPAEPDDAEPVVPGVLPGWYRQGRSHFRADDWAPGCGPVIPAAVPIDRTYKAPIVAGRRGKSHQQLGFNWGD